MRNSEAPFPSGDAVSDNIQGQLFEEAPPAPEPATGLFAEVVFDRPLDHAYSYSVPAGLRDAVAVGKRVVAPFGRGDKATTGYCVRSEERRVGNSRDRPGCRWV